MHYIDMENWERRSHFTFFNMYKHPQLAITAHVDITKFYPFRKERAISFTIAMVYILTRAANEVPAFRQRIRDGRVVEHDIIHPGFTILVSDDVFSFCFSDYYEAFTTFAEKAEKDIEAVRQHLVMEDIPGRDDFYYMTAIPWVSFTHLEHPLIGHPGDAIPLFAWGKYFQENDQLKMPVNIKVHHALVDGIHVGQFFETLQHLLDTPEILLK